MGPTNPAESKEDITGTPLDAILERLRNCAGFPTLSSTIGDINNVVSSEHSTGQLTQVILRDASLTTKLLQVVNSAVYGQYRGRIRTVSKAVLILGSETVRNAAMSLMMLEFTRGRPQERALQDELTGAFFAGVVAKSLCRHVGVANSEEAVICTMFQSLGRLLVIFFLYEESQRVRELAETGMSEDQAAHNVLGISYSELGIGIARHWEFPMRLIEAMRRLTPRDMTRPNNETDRLRIAANLANELYYTAMRTSDAEKPAALEALSRRYRTAVKLQVKDMVEAVEQGLAEIADRATTLNLSLNQSVTLDTIRVFIGKSPEEAKADESETTTPKDSVTGTILALDAREAEKREPATADEVLSAGIRDVTETLTADFALNDVLQMVLETMYRGMDFSRTLIFVRDARHNTMRARLGFGDGIDTLLPRCSFPLAFAPDVFHLALDKGADIVIEDTRATNIAERIPRWYRDVIDAKSFLLLPVVLKAQAIGLLYADTADARALKIAPEQLGLLRTLRSQVVLAFKHSTHSA